jgi:hypothetical protein
LLPQNQRKKLLQVVELRGFLSPIMCRDFLAVRWLGAKFVSGKKIGFNAHFLIFFEEEKSGIEH